MVEVFRQMAYGTVALTSKMHLLARDRDWGSGDLAGGRIGATKSVEQLLWLMIDDSDNTATNMLIRRVGRQHVNATMTELGLRATRLDDDIRSDGNQIRYALRSSPRDMVKLLDLMARNHLVDEWSSREMLAIFRRHISVRDCVDLARFGGFDERSHYCCVAGRTVQRGLDRQHVRVGSGCTQKMLDRTHKRVVRVVH